MGLKFPQPEESQKQRSIHYNAPWISTSISVTK